MSVPFDPSPGDHIVLTMPARSRYAGQPINVARRRSIVIRTSESQSEVSPADTHLTVDYFFHAGAFWTAVIPLNAVVEVAGQMFNFSSARTRRTKGGVEVLHDKDGLPRRKLPFLNHVQSRFRLRDGEPVDLHPLGTEEFGEPAHRIRDFVCSFEVAGPAGTRFNLRDALAGHFVSAHRFLSTVEMVFERIVVENRILTESPPLPLNEEQKRTVLVESLLASHRAMMSQAYYLFRPFGTNNCTSTPFQILDRVMPYTRKQRWGSFLYRLPLNPRLYLRVRGLDANPGHRRIVHQEFADYIHHPDTQSRKRDFIHRRAEDRVARRPVGGST